MLLCFEEDCFSPQRLRKHYREVERSIAKVRDDECPQINRSMNIAGQIHIEMHSSCDNMHKIYVNSIPARNGKVGKVATHNLETFSNWLLLGFGESACIKGVVLKVDNAAGYAKYMTT